MVSTGCSEQATEGIVKQPQKLLVPKADGDNVTVYEVNVDIIDYTLSLDSDALYEINTLDKTMYSIFPHFMSLDNMILYKAPVKYNKYDDVGVSEEIYPLFYENYSLQYNKEEMNFTITKDNDSLYNNVPLVYEGTRLRPMCFFVDTEGKIAVLCMTAVSQLDTEIVTLLYSAKEKDLSLLETYEYPTIWEDYNISKIQCPITFNTCASLQNKCFLYNESVKLFTISPYNGSVTCVLEEKDVETVLPQIDTSREGYSFFNHFGYQNGYYMATFPAYNSIAGYYTVFFKTSGEYMGCLLCAEDKLTLYDKNHVEMESIADNFHPSIYIPTY